MSSMKKKEIDLQTLTYTKRPTKPGLHPWFRDNIGLAEFIERKRRQSTSSDRVTPSLKKRSTSANRKQQELARKKAEISYKSWPGFTIHFSLSAAIKSVKRQEKEIYRPNLKPSKINRPTLVTTPNEPKKRAKPLLKRFVFDFESRKWKQELLIEGRTSITTELLIPESTLSINVNKSNDSIPKICRNQDKQLTTRYNILTHSRQSLYTSADDDDDDDYDDDYSRRFCHLGSATSSGRDTSCSDVSLVNSTKGFVDRSPVWTISDQKRQLSAPCDNRAREGSPKTTTPTDHSNRSLSESDLQQPSANNRPSPLFRVPTLVQLAAAVWSKVERRAQSHSVSSIYGLIRSPSGECLSKQRYRIIDADSRQDIGEMRYISRSGSKVAIRKRRIQRESRTSSSSQEAQPEPGLVASDTEDLDNVIEQYPGCRYLYRIAYCKAVTDPALLIGKPHCRKRAAGIIDVYTGHTTDGQMTSAEVICPYCVQEPSRRIHRWLESCKADGAVHLYTSKDYHYYTRATTHRKQKSRESLKLRPISEL